MDSRDRYLEEQYLSSKAYENAEVYTSSEGNETTPLRDLDPSSVQLLDIGEIQKEDGEVFRVGYFEVTLPNGEKAILTVDKDGQDMSLDFVDDEGNSQKFMLTPRMKREIFKFQVEAKMSTEELQDALFPSSQDEMEKEIAQDTLVPKSAEETIKKIKEKNPEADVREVNNEEQQEEAEKQEPDEEEIEEDNEIEIPEKIKDKVEEIRESEGAQLKHVLIARNPSSISDQLIDTAGLQDNGGPVYCLAFANADLSSGSDRIIFVQGERVVDDRRYDEDATNMMNDYRHASVVENVTDKDSKVYYTDIDGHTTVADLVATPKDLRRQDKDILAEKLNELENKQKGILNSTNLTVDEKIEKCQEINQERLQLFDEYGLDIPNIRSEISADIDIGEEVQDDIEDSQQEDAETEKEDDDEEGRDPREANHNHERNLY